MLAERGKLLFRVSAENRRHGYLWLAVGVVFAVLYGFEAYRGHWSDWGFSIYFVAYGLSFFLARWVAFYESGIHFPNEPMGGRGGS